MDVSTAGLSSTTLRTIGLVLLVVGLIALVLGIIYLAVPAHSLPSFMGRTRTGFNPQNPDLNGTQPAQSHIERVAMPRPACADRDEPDATAAGE